MSPMREGMSPQVKAALEQCRWMITKGLEEFFAGSQTVRFGHPRRGFLPLWLVPLLRRSG